MDNFKKKILMFSNFLIMNNNFNFSCCFYSFHYITKNIKTEYIFYTQKYILVCHLSNIFTNCIFGNIMNSTYNIYTDIN